MKAFKTIIAAVLILVCTLVVPVPSVGAAKENKVKVIDKTIYLYTEVYDDVFNFYDESGVYYYSYSVSDRECIRVENYREETCGYELEITPKKLTAGKKKPVITVYRKKNGGTKQVFKKYRITVKNPPVINQKIAVNKDALKLTKLSYDNRGYSFTEPFSYKYSDKSVAKLVYDNAFDGYGSELKSHMYGSTRYQRGSEGICFNGLNYGSSRVKVYLKGTKVKVGDFKVTVKDIKPSIKKKFKTVDLYYSTYGEVEKNAFCAEYIVNGLRKKSKLSVKIADKKTVNSFKSSDEDNLYNFTEIYAKKVGKTKAAFYETLGGKKRKIGTVKIVVHKAKMKDVALCDPFWDSRDDFEPTLYPGDTYSAKDYGLSVYLWGFKKKDYTVTYKSTHPEIISIDKNGVFKILKADNEHVARIKYKIVFSDSSKLSGSFAVYIESRGADSSGQFICEKNSDGTLNIKRYIGLDTSPVIPETIDGKTVKSIGENFVPRGVTEVTIPASVTKIDDLAFNFTNVKKINVDGENKKYSSSEDGVLFNRKKTVLTHFPPAKKLSSYTVPDGVEEIHKYAFFSSQIESVTLPSSVTTIGDHAFANSYDGTAIEEPYVVKSRIKSVTLSEGLQYIEDYAFDGSPIGSIKLPSTLKEIGERAFAFTDLTSVSIPAKIKVISDGAFYCCKKLETVNLPEGVKELEQSAFGACKLKTLKLPSSLTTIGGEGALNSVESIILPENLKYLDAEAFGEDDDSSLKRITVSKNNKHFSAKDNVLYNKDKTVLVLYPAHREKKDFSIPKTVNSLRSHAFIYSKINSLTIPASVTKIGSYSFDGCRIKKLVIKNGVKSIAHEAFNNCTIGGKIIIPDSVTSFSRGAFNYCNLNSFRVPKCVKNIKSDDFWFDDVRELVIPPHVKSVDKDGFYWMKYLKPTVKGKNGTAAQEFAKANKLKFKSM